MVVFPNAKINLGLNIIEKRKDGYHNIESVFIPIPLKEALEITTNEQTTNSFKTIGIDIPSDGKPNLVERAWDLLNKEFGIPCVDFELLKNIPIGAGLGGGSSDAAFCLNGLIEMFNLTVSEDKLLEIASQLGADCAFFVKNEPTFAQGIGDKFSSIEVNLSGNFLCLIYPNIHVSTPAAYKHVSAKKPKEDIREILKEPIPNWKGRLVNDFENSVFPQFPEIKHYKELLYSHKAKYASMSGSGSTLFGFFDKQVDIKVPSNISIYWFEL